MFFNLFRRKPLKVETFSAQGGVVNVTLSNGKTHSFDIKAVSPDKFMSDLLMVDVGIVDLSEVVTQYKGYCEMMANTAAEEKPDEDIIGDITRDSDNILSGDDLSVGDAGTPTEETTGEEEPTTTEEAVVVEEKEYSIGTEKTMASEEPQVADLTVTEEPVQLATVVPTPTIAINEEAIGQITTIIESDALDIMRISEVLMKAGEAGVSKDGFTFKLSDVEGDVIIEKDGVEEWDMDLESPEEKQRILDILKSIE